MFELLRTDTSSKARVGRLTTVHGAVDTPVFMSVGTQGSVKAIDPRELREMGAQIILGNTYHLNIRPGMDLIRAAGGRHAFINWPAPILTGSGGFQVFSLPPFAKSRHTGWNSGHIWTVRCSFWDRRRRWASNASWVPTSRWCLTTARRTPARRANCAQRSNARCVGPPNAASSRAPRARWSSV